MPTTDETARSTRLATMELDGVGRGSGGKRVANIVDKLSAGGAASEGEKWNRTNKPAAPSPY